MKTIYLAGGCFWGAEAFLKRLRGVTRTAVGYANGRTAFPTYEQVKYENTGHAETVMVEYDETVISTACLLRHFFTVIDPTRADGQGHDEGRQYRTGIYYSDPADSAVIHAELHALGARCARPIVTEALKLQNFYPAEEYHQDYLNKNPGGYCHIDTARILEAAQLEVWA